MGNYTSIERLPLLLLISLLRGFSDMIRRSWFDLSWCYTTSTNTNFSFSSRVFFFLQVLWKRTNRNDSRTSSVFNFLSIFLHFSLLTWLNSHSSRKPIKREVCIHANISLCHGCEDVPWTSITLSTLFKIWKIRGRRELNFWYTKVGGPKR